MKICFSTLGCPEWSWEEILATAKDLGYDGIELRGIGNQMYVPRAKPFLPGKIERVKRELEEKGLEIACVTSSCYLHKKDRESYLKEGRDYIDLATKLDAPFIRVLGDSAPEPGEDVDREQVADMLGELGDYALGKNVTVLIETNGVFADSEVMSDLMQKVAHPAVAVLWDINHPYRFMGEPVSLTYNRLKNYIRHVHIKDSRMEGGKVRYCMIGQGDLPLGEALKLLKSDGYSGYLSLEWVKRWYNYLEEPGIVFSHFIDVVRELLGR